MGKFNDFDIGVMATTVVNMILSFFIDYDWALFLLGLLFYIMLCLLFNKRFHKT